MPTLHLPCASPECWRAGSGDGHCPDPLHPLDVGTVDWGSQGGQGELGQTRQHTLGRDSWVSSTCSYLALLSPHLPGAVAGPGPCPAPTPALPLQFPSMKKTLEFRAHDGEIEDIALGPDNKVVTAGRDFQCCVWQQDQLVTGLRWHENLPGIPDKAYRYQACRFGAVEGSAGALRLYTVQVPHKRERRPPPCYLTKWDGKSFLPLLTRPCGSEVVSSPTHYPPPQLYYVKEAHGIVVTDVAFVPESRPGRELLGGHEAALLSVAVDSRCKLHLLPSRRSLPVWLLLLLCAGLIVATILLLQLAFPGFL
uniref:Prolactin regulatory element binding n=1 Tax=Ficedula albicollis TaxID=59894 RepID=U3K823_FICAL